MKENPNLEQEYYSRTTKGSHRIAHDSNRLSKWMAHFDRNSENIYCIDPMASVLTCLIGLSYGGYCVEVKDKRYLFHLREKILLRLRDLSKSLGTQYEVQDQYQVQNQKVMRKDNKELIV